MELKANAKINLFLRVAGIDERGFHILDSLVFSADIFDTVVINRAFKTDKENAAPFAINTDYEKNAFAEADTINEKRVTDGENGVYLKMSKPIYGKNNALAVAEKLREKYGLPKLNISVEKRIPVAAGLGGSSADVAAVIFGVKKLFGVEIDESRRFEFGDDVPFMLSGGAAAVCGGADLLFGKREIFMEALKRYTFLVAKPFGEMLTKRVFEVYDGIKKSSPPFGETLTERICKVCDGIKKANADGEIPIKNELNIRGETVKKSALNEPAITLRKEENDANISKLIDGIIEDGKETIRENSAADISRLIDGIIEDDKEKIRENLTNDLYEAAAAIDPNLKRVRGKIIDAGAFACVMTGSGNAFVGLFDSSAAAEYAAKNLKGYEEIILCNAVEKGIVEY
jgi:4-diphosphocytidyl-2C-methyl-D-erythritol kinase